MGPQATLNSLMLVMVVAGALTTLVTKYQVCNDPKQAIRRSINSKTRTQDTQCVFNCHSPNASENKKFKQPVWQTDQVFAGETVCWLLVVVSSSVSYISKRVVTHTRDNFKSTRSFLSLSRRDSVQSDITNTTPLLTLTNPNQHKIKLHVIALPAMCDLLSTTLLNVGLFFVAPSIYQMTRGIVVLFSCFFSVCFLNRRVERYQWLALLLIVLSVAIVGLAGSTEYDPVHREHPGLDYVESMHSIKPSLHVSDAGHGGEVYVQLSQAHVVRRVLGICIILCAQIFAAGQFVLEEAVLSRNAITPLQLVGSEGLSGLIVTVVSQVIAHAIYGRTALGRSTIFDMPAGWREISQNRNIWIASILMMGFTGLFNYCALSVTRRLGATSRCVADSLRTLLIWVVSLSLGWEKFKYLQLIGFIGLVYGNLIFNNVVKRPGFLLLGIESVHVS
ncbi:MAG: hypothetical protein Q9179_004766 [Wetmoreana sp. 5 TL-2023]